MIMNVTGSRVGLDVRLPLTVENRIGKLTVRAGDLFVFETVCKCLYSLLVFLWD